MNAEGLESGSAAPNQVPAAGRNPRRAAPNRETALERQPNLIRDSEPGWRVSNCRRPSDKLANLVQRANQIPGVRACAPNQVPAASQAATRSRSARVVT